MKAVILREARRARRLQLRDRLSRSEGRRRPRRDPGAGDLVQLPRRLHRARHARHQGADADDHRARHGGRDPRGRRRASSGWKTGDRVLVNPLNKQKGLMGEMMHGGLAEKCLVAEHQLIRMPDGVTLRAGGVAARRLRHGAPHDDHARHDQEGRQGAGARRERRRRHRLRAAREDAGRGSDRVRVAAPTRSSG